jgi:RNA polymerase sigma factor (sigma-70 family)
MEEPTDTQLIAACKRGDQRAWKTLVHKYERLVYSIARTMGLPEPDAADVTQSVFVELIHGLEFITNEEVIGAWLSTVTRRKVWKTFEQNRRERDSIATAAILAAPITDEYSEYMRADDIDWVHQGLEQLSSRCRELLIALYFTRDPLSYQELSEALGVPLGSLGPTRGRCLEQLQTILRSLV